MGRHRDRHGKKLPGSARARHTSRPHTAPLRPRARARARPPARDARGFSSAPDLSERWLLPRAPGLLTRTPAMCASFALQEHLNSPHPLSSWKPPTQWALGLQASNDVA